MVFKTNSFCFSKFTKKRKAITLTQTPSPDGRENPLLIKREASFINKDYFTTFLI